MKKIKLSIFESLLKSQLSLQDSQNPNMNKLSDFIESLSSGEDMSDPFFSRALQQIRDEIGESINGTETDPEEILKCFWKIFFPEGLLYFEKHDKIIEHIREKRTISIKELNKNPIHDIPGEMTFTSNVLLTVPHKNTDLNALDIPDSIRKSLPPVMNEEQLYWFDHPVQIGELPERNEIIYGLKGLSESFAFEKKLNHAAVDAKLDVILSVSVTHKGLQNLAAPYLKYELSKCDDIKDLNVYIFTEESCTELLKAFTNNAGSISKYFGVDGKYGRHYNFLKAVNIIWKTVINENLKGTFKIDLDQVFPQEELISYTGKSAFEHFQSPLWGAKGTDTRGKSVDLSMIAGALVNESDIKKSLFTPDVSLPTLKSPLNDLVFFKHLSMALSTRAELMTRYNSQKDLDGINKVISRIHVTGGTNGILINALLKYRPFTPSFIGRAEDQAYILSVLNSQEEPLLRYYHEDGLIMRHDKEAFAGESIKAAKDGTYIADIMRILYYTYYAQALPGGSEKTKEETYPFTGSYITAYPVTLSYLRLFFKLIEMYEEGLTERADLMLEMGKNLLQPLINELITDNFLKKDFHDEKEQWNLFYDEITRLNSDISNQKESALNKRENIRKIIEDCRII
jgi:hypothetical protein